MISSIFDFGLIIELKIEIFIFEGSSIYLYKQIGNNKLETSLTNGYS